MGKLTDLQVKTAKAGKHTDGHGLYLFVSEAGGKLWRYDYRFGDKRKTLSLGQYPTLKLSEARVSHLAAVKSVADGIDPSLTKRRDKQRRQVAGATTFESVARIWLDKSKGQRMTSTNDQVGRWLELDVYPHIGKLPIDKIETADVVEVLNRLSARGLQDTVSRVQGIINRILKYATASKLMQENPVLNLVRADHQIFIKPNTSRPAITTPHEFAGLIRSVRGYEGSATVANAINLLPLLVCRPGELRHLRWEWVDFDGAVIRLPSSVMKMKVDHLIPLSRQAIGILRQQQAISGHLEMVFPGQRGQGRPLSENTLNAVLRACGYSSDMHVAHGFRASFLTLGREVQELKFDREQAELQLAHKTKNPLGQAYDRASFLPERAAMLQRWADWLDEITTGAEVIQFPRVAA